MIKVLIVGDIRLYSEGLADVLGRRRDMRVTGIASDHHQCLDQVRANAPDVTLIDMAMPDSLQTVKAIRDLEPEVKVVALAVPELESEIITCVEAGVAGYVPREASLADLIASVLGAVKGELRCPPRMVGTLVKRISVLAACDPIARTAPVLTRREAEIVVLIDRGLTNKEIAARLGCSPYTVKTHIHNALKKIKVSHRSEAAAWMRRQLNRRSLV